MNPFNIDIDDFTTLTQQSSNNKEISEIMSYTSILEGNFFF